MNAIKQQRGVTMISVLIGLLISMIVVVALMNVFGNVIHVTANANGNTTNDNQVTSLLMRASTSMLDAGYGISSPTLGTDFVVIQNATLSSATNGTLAGTAVGAGSQGNAVVWDTNLNPTAATPPPNQCAGLLSYQIPKSVNYTVTYLSPVPCTSAAQWSSLSWTTTAAVVQPTAKLSPDALLNASNVAPVNFTATAANPPCRPYNVTSNSTTVASGGKWQVTLAAPSSVVQNGAPILLSITQCLLNIAAP